MPDRRASYWRRDLGPLKRLRLALFVMTFLAWAGPARATTVVLVWPPAPSADVTQALTLLRGELWSVGIEVTRAERANVHGAGAPDSVAWLEALAARGASAVIDAIGDDALEAIDVWVVKSQPRRFEVTHVAVEPNAPKQPEVVALRAVEALRAGLLQIDWAARRRRPAPVAPEPPSPPVIRSDEPTHRLSLELGAVAMMSLDGVGPAFLPTAHVAWLARAWLMIQASVAGLGSRPPVTTTAGSARVAQQYAIVGAYYRLRAPRLWPFFGLAAGVLRTSVDGQASFGPGGQSSERWSGLLDLGLGAGLRLFNRFYVALAAHAQVAEPYLAIHIVDKIDATSGRPNLLLTLTLGAWL